MSRTQAHQEQQFTRNLQHWQRFKNFGDGSCGPYSVLQHFLVLRYGMHPRDVESIFSSEKTGDILELVRLCRKVTVRMGKTIYPDDLTFGAFTGGDERGKMESDQRHLDTREAWEKAMFEDDGHFDLRAMDLLAFCLGMESKVVTRLDNDQLRDVNGLSNPLEPTGCVYHQHRHFEFMVYKKNVSYEL